MYSIGQAFKNIFRNMRLSLASTATVSACVFLFCLFFCVIANLQAMIVNVETKVGITVFFDEDLTDAQIQDIGERIAAQPEVRETQFVSADDAWESFKSEYFEGREELAEGFADDNPLKGSSSYSIWLKDASRQDDFIEYLENQDGVRQVNYTTQAGSLLTGINNAILVISVILIGMLLAVSIFLIRNTVIMSAEFRKNETAIMRLVGATNAMIRAPFIIEGVTLGFIGSVISLTVSCILYNYAVGYVSSHYTMVSDILQFLPHSTLFPVMAAASLFLGAGIGFFTSLFALNRHLKV